MTTFDQALANLQANSNQMAASAKGYNVDVAKFETKKAQDLSRLFLFAGEVGKDISNRLAERKAREEQAENLWGEIFGAGESDPNVINNITQVEESQVKTSNILADSIKDRNIDPYLGFRGINETGIGDRATAATQVYGIGAEFTPWYYNTIQNDTRTFLAVTSDHPNGREIALNATDLTRDEQFARLQYLQKEYTSAKVGGYSKEFLTYSQADGGSGYAASLIEQGNTIKQNLVKNTNIQTGLNSRNQSKDIFYNTTEWNKSTFQSAVSLFLNSSNLEGTGIMRRDKAWKAFHDMIKEGVETGNITREELEKIVDLDLGFEINGNKTLAGHLPELYGTGRNSDGAQGTMFTEADDYKAGLNSDVDKRNENIKLTELAAVAKEYQAGDYYTINDAGKEEINELALITKLGKICKDGRCDVSEEKEKILARPTKYTQPKVDKMLKDYYASDYKNRLPLEMHVGSFSKDVKGHETVVALIDAQNQLIKDNKGLFDNIENAFKDITVNEGGNKEKDWKHPSAQTMWKISRGRFLKILEDNEKLTDGTKKNPELLQKEFLAQLKEDQKNKSINTQWSKYDKYKNDQNYDMKDFQKTQFTKNGKYDKEAHQEWLASLETDIYARDTNFNYRNATKHPLLSGDYNTTFFEEIENEKTNLNNSDLLFYEQELVNKSDKETFDYNEVIKNIDLNNIENSELGELNKICTAQEKSLLECIQTRANALGQTLTKETIEALGNGVLGKNDPLDIAEANGNAIGWFTNAELGATISEYEDFAGTYWIDQGGEEAESHMISFGEVYSNLIDDDGKWKPEFKEVGKTLLGFDLGILSDLHPYAKYELNDANALFELTKTISPEDKLTALKKNDVAAYEAYKNTGILAFVPKDPNPRLQEKTENDEQYLLNILNTNRTEIASLKDEDIPIKSEETNQTSFQNPDVIGASLTPNYTTT